MKKRFKDKSGAKGISDSIVDYLFAGTLGGAMLGVVGSVFVREYSTLIMMVVIGGMSGVALVSSGQARPSKARVRSEDIVYWYAKKTRKLSRGVTLREYVRFSIVNVFLFLLHTVFSTVCYTIFLLAGMATKWILQAFSVGGVAGAIVLKGLEMVFLVGGLVATFTYFLEGVRRLIIGIFREEPQEQREGVRKK